MRGRVWVLSELYHPEHTSTGYFMTGIAEALAERFDTRVFCSQPTYAVRGLTAPWRETHNGVQITRCRSTRFHKDRLPGRVTNMLTFSATVMQRALRGIRPGDAVLAVTNPPTLPFIAAASARARGAKFVLLIHDLYPDVLVATGVAAPDSRVVRTAGALTNRLYASADRIVVLGRDMHTRVARRLPPGREDRLVVIPNWGDLENVRPDGDARAVVRQRLGLGERFVVQFMGNLGRTHGVETVVDAARLLSDDSRIHVQFVGWGSRAAWLRETVAAEAHTNVSVHGPAPADELSGWLNAADAAVIAFLPGMSGVSVPSRLYNILAAGRPVLGVCDADSELALVIGEERAGLVTRPQCASELAAAVRALVADPTARSAMGRRARAAAEAHYGYRTVARQYHDLLDGLLDRAPRVEAGVALQ
jgi:colanic acid biosynthesis glycosyl transferase WcaI